MDEQQSIQQEDERSKAERFGEIVAIPVVLALIVASIILLVGLFQGPKIVAYLDTILNEETNEE